MTPRQLSIGIAVASCAALVSCAGGSNSLDSPSPAAKPSEATTEPPSARSYKPHPEGLRFHLAAVDAVLEGIEAGSPSRLRDLLAFQSVGCEAEPGIGGPPQCLAKDGEVPGQQVAVFPVDTCEREWRRAASVGDVLSSATSEMQLIAIAQSDEKNQFDIFVADPTEARWAIWTVTAEQITGLKVSCGPTDLAPYLSQRSSFLLPPVDAP